MLRILYNNLITSESMLAVSSAKTGIVTTALKSGTGSAVITTGGTYTGTTDLEYVIEIDGAGTGEVGSATFKWSDDGGATWDATTVTTDDTTAIDLNNGVTVLWTGGTGADFVLADKWYFKALQPFSAGRMVDLDRDHRYRSAALGSPNTITVTLGTEAQADALIIYDHNFTSGATIHLYGDDAATFDSAAGSPQVDETITWAPGKILHYLTTADRTKKYWQLRVADAGNADTYIEIGELFLGTYVEFSKNFSEGFGRPTEFIMDTNKTPYGIERDRFFNFRKTFTMDMSLIVSADITKLEALLEAIGSRATGVFKPIWINTDSSTTADHWLVKLTGLPLKHHSLTYYDTPLEFKEVMRSV